MKLKFYALIASAFFLAAFAMPAGADLIEYKNVGKFEEYFEGVPDIELVQLTFKELERGSDDSIAYIGGDENFFSIDFNKNNTAFGIRLKGIKKDSPAIVTFYLEDENGENPPMKQKKSQKDS